MKRLYFLSIFFLGSLTVVSQPVDLVLNTPKSGVKIHQALNSITFAAGYSYTSNGGTMLAEIVDEAISGDIVYSPAIDPANYLINTSLSVGKTAGNLLVNGGAIYTIPIEVPGGTNGFQPTISLNYVSNLADGILGIGWGIGGISTITRINKSIYNDGIQDAVRGNLTDKYALDGNRLIVVSGTYGAENSEYRTEIEGFSKIASFGSTGTGPEWFKVYTKSGLIYEFGNSTIAQLPFAKIQFNYKNRSDVTSYSYGEKIFIRNILLDNIEVKYNELSCKKYVLTYMIDTYSHLQKVTEQSSQDAALNPTVFAWTVQTEQFSETTHYSSLDLERYYNGDFNGDGRIDFVTVPVKTSYSSADKWKLYLADANGTMVYSTEGDLNTAFETFLVGDFNGDGLTDLMMQEKHPEQPTYPNKKYYYFYQSTGTNFTRSVSYYLCYNSDRLDVVDYNGDGILEFMFHNTSNNWYLYTYSGASIYSASIPSFGEYYVIDIGLHNRILDFNGDGCSDLLVLFSNGYKVYEFKGTNNILIETYSGADIINSDFITFGDYNGDGNTDIVKRTIYNQDDWSMLYLTGGGFQSHELNSFDNFDINKDKNRLFSRDVNADGRTDVIIIGQGQSTENPTNRINVAVSNGNDFSIQEYISSVNLQIGYYDIVNFTTWEEHLQTEFFYFEDYKGDGRMQFFYKYPNISKLFSFASGTPSHLVNTVIDGIGAKTSFSYQPMSNSAVYTRGSGAIYPVNDFSSSAQLVSQVSSDNGIGGTTSITYKYEGAKMHRQGKGALGFSKLTTTDITAGILTETLSGYHNSYYYPQVNTVTKKTPGGEPIETTSNTWTQLVLDATTKRIFPYVQTTTQANVLTGHSVTESISSVDSYGNPTQIVKSYDNGITETTVNNYSETLNITDWLVGRIGSSTVTFAKSGETPVSQAVRFTYSTDGIINPDFIYYYEGTPLEYSKNHDYDSKGNLSQVLQPFLQVGQHGIQLQA